MQDAVSIFGPLAWKEKSKRKATRGDLTAVEGRGVEKTERRLRQDNVIEVFYFGLVLPLASLSVSGVCILIKPGDRLRFCSSLFELEELIGSSFLMIILRGRKHDFRIEWGTAFIFSRKWYSSKISACEAESDGSNS